MCYRPDDDPRLYAAILCYLESVQRGGPPDGDGQAADCPDLAAEVQGFADTYARLEHLLAPVREVARMLLG
jgi:hypothetical protein